MRPIPPGYEARLEIVVTPEMTVHFDELGRVHDVYATYWMARHMEEAGRKIILDFLDDDEDGIGASLSVRHLAPVRPGTKLLVTARHERTEGTRVLASCSVTDESGRIVGDGATGQVVLKKSELAALLKI